MKIKFERKRNRLPEFDYSSQGAYFITICTKDRFKIFWAKKDSTKNVSPADAFNDDDVVLSELGTVVDNEIKKISEVYKTVKISKYCIMPDHLHLIIEIFDVDGEKRPDIPRIIKQFKGVITKKTGLSIWQRSYHDRVLRDEKDYQAHWEYIEMNPKKWAWDEHREEF